MNRQLTLTIPFILAAAHLCAEEVDLQKMIDNTSSGGTVMIPSGTYNKPIAIAKPITIEGNGAVLKIESNQPAIQLDTSRRVVIKNLQIQYQTKTTPEKGEFPYAVYSADGDLVIEDCTFKATGTSEESPCAVLATDKSTLAIKNSRFDGFDFTIQFWGETEGMVEDCLIVNPGHCGITIGGESAATLNRNIVTGSRYHGIRCTGGEIIADSNLVIANRNRGFYIGNKSASGTLSNNLILDNATGINVFARSDIEMLNNVILRSTYAGLALADTATLEVENNVIADNERGIIGFSAGKGDTPSIRLGGENIVHGNNIQSEGIKQPSEMIGIDPQFSDPDAGLFALEAGNSKGMGLSSPADMQRLWNKWKEATR